MGTFTKLSNGNYINTQRLIGASVMQSKANNKWYVTLETDVIVKGKEDKEETLKKFFEIESFEKGEELLKSANLI